jgi:hypothetical protein
MINNQYISIGIGGDDTVAKENKPNFKKKEPYSKNNNREEFAEHLDINKAKRNNGQQNNQQNR